MCGLLVFLGALVMLALASFVVLAYSVMLVDFVLNAVCALFRHLASKQKA